MHSPQRFGARLVFAFLLLLTWSAAEERRKGPFWFEYDVYKPGHLELCNEKSCKEWEPSKTFFRTGSVIRLRVINGKFRSTFKVVVNGITVADAVPQVRGVSTVSAMPQAAPPTPLPPQLPKLQSTAPLELQAIKEQYKKAADAIAKSTSELQSYLDLYLGPKLENEQTGSCSTRTINIPTSTIDDIANFTAQLASDAQACDNTNGQPFKNEDAFNNLTDRADRLIQSVTLLDSVLAAQPDVSAARTQWEVYQGLVARFQQTFPGAASDPSTSESVSYVSGRQHQSLLDSETKMEALAQAVPQGLTQINKSMAKAFAYINTLYSISESSHSFDIPVGEYNTNYAAGFSIYEIANSVVYKVVPAKAPAPSDQSDPDVRPAPIHNPFGSPDPQPRGAALDNVGRDAILIPTAFKSDMAALTSPFPADTTKPQTCCPQQQNSGPGKLLYSGTFDVHKMYRANLVAGFFVSRLENRPYGLTNNGQASSSSNITFVTVTGEPYRPQLHAFVGVNVYLWERDVFPGQMSKQGFLWFKPHGWLNGYWNPGVMVGYGVDSLNNYLVGLNWETKWAFNVGTGLHVGQESFLQPGIVPGVTQLPSTTTAVPTFNKTACALYGSVGFDFGVMKTALSQLFGGGSSTGK